MSAFISLGTPYGAQASTCGYCSPPGGRSTKASNRYAAGLDVLQLSCDVYQKMIDRGWRRSGTWCYKPDMKRSCCPQYTIKLDALNFEASKRHRKLLSRWNRFILRGDNETNGVVAPVAKSNSKAPSFSLVKEIHSSEKAFCEKTPAHNFEIILEPANYTEEKYAFFCKYQKDIHQDSESTPSGFNRFLCKSPLIPEEIPYSSPPPDHLPKNYGSYHQVYRLDGKTAAIAVLDILPYCTSSVYFMYDKAWERYSLGKLSALREVALSKEMQHYGAPGMSSLYMGVFYLPRRDTVPMLLHLQGYYIHTCPKMKYKGEYSPSYLLDPESYEWFPLETCLEALNKNRYACFSDPKNSTNEPPAAKPDIVLSPSEKIIRKIKVSDGIEDGRLSVKPLKVNRIAFFAKPRLTFKKSSVLWSQSHKRAELFSCIFELGDELSTEIIFDE